MGESIENSSLRNDIDKSADAFAKEVLATRYRDEYWHEYNQFIIELANGLKRKIARPDGNLRDM